MQDIDYRSTCPTLVACLSELRDWSDATPGHLPVVINLELKDGELPAPFDATEITPFDATQLDAVDDDGEAADSGMLVLTVEDGEGWSVTDSMLAVSLAPGVQGVTLAYEYSDEGLDLLES